MWSMAFLFLFSAILCHTSTCCAQAPCLLPRAQEVAPDTIRLNMQREMEYYPVDSMGKWTETYNSGVHTIDFDIFTFSHLINNDGIPGSQDVLSYWDGFTMCTSGDDRNYGLAGSSNGWIERQWGCMAGGGIDSTGVVVKGAPYLVAYWGGAMAEADAEQTVQVSFNDGVTHRPLGVWICNHPWPYYGSSDSDGFAHGFASNGDYFAVIAHGLDEEGHDVGKTVTHYLAQFHGDTLDQSTEWQWLDLRELGQVSAVYFTMESTDYSGLGMNTAAYFCLGGIEVLEHVDMYKSPSNVKATALGETEIELTWQGVNGAAYYRILQEGVLTDSTTSTTYLVKALNAYTDYYFHVQAISPYGEESELKYAGAKTLDTTVPTMPLNLKAVAHETTIDLSWDASTDNVSVTKYTVYVNGTREARPKKTSYTIIGMAPGTTYTIGVEAMDQSNNSSERAIIVVSTLPITPTEVETASLDDTLPIRCQKVIINGQLYIGKDNMLFDIFGKRVR